jgi:long-chain acyl-CoA synthetase
MLSIPVRQQPRFQFPRWAQGTPAKIPRFLAYYLLIWPATFLLARPHIRGREHLRDLSGSVLFVANHITQVDIALILAALPARFRHHLAVAMMGEMLQKMRNPPPEASFIRRCIERLSYILVVALFNAFPLPQKAGFRESFAFAGESADRGYSILVFPEGMRTKDGNINPFQAGIGLLTANLGMPVVPIRIDGLFELKKTGKLAAKSGAVRITIGSAVHYRPGTDPIGIVRDLEERIQYLKL